MNLAPIVLEHGEIYGRLAVLRKEGSRYLCGCGVCGHKQHFRAKALMRADGVRSCRKCRLNHVTFNPSIYNQGEAND